MRAIPPVVFALVLVGVMAAAWADGRDVKRDEPPANADNWRLTVYRLTLFRGGKPILSVGVDSEAELRTLLRELIIRYSPTHIAVWDVRTAGGQWWHPAGKDMGAAWDGRLPVKVEVKAGSANL